MENRVLPANISLYDLVNAIGIRIEHIDQGHVIYVNHDGESEEIAIEEIRQKMSPLSIKRMVSEGNYEIWDVNELIIDLDDLTF